MAQATTPDHHQESIASPSGRGISRRAFFQLSAAGVLTLYARNAFGQATALAAAIPGGTLNPSAICKFATPLLVPPAMPMTRRITSGGGSVDYYEIATRQFSQQILPPSLPPTTVWGYGSVSGGTNPSIFNAPSLTIEAKHGTPVRIKWINQLVDQSGNFLPHLLPVDPTLHWANPRGGVNGRDMRPTFSATPGRYRGPVPNVTHVHGSVGVGDESDGYPEAWYLPDAADLPPSFASEGTWYEFFKKKAARKFGVKWGPGSATSQYPNSQRATTIWYHDHTLGMTRLNVYAGPAGFYLIRGGTDDQVRDTRTKSAAVLPGPAPAIGDAPNTKYYEIPLAIQDRSFNKDGSLFYPDSREFFDGVAGPYVPDTDLSPIWNPEFFGNCMMVNGKTWPFVNIEKRRYRFRLLNGCNARFLIPDFSHIPGVSVWQIGNDGGFLKAPVNLTEDFGNRLVLGPAERADVIVDFTRVPVGRFELRNVGPDEPYGGGDPDTDFSAADPKGTGKIMQFRVSAATSPDTSTPAKYLKLPALTSPTGGRVRRLALLEQTSATFAESPVMAQLGRIAGDPGQGPASWSASEWGDAITENPRVGTTEVWEFYNTTEDAHPMHVHEVALQVIDRQPIDVDAVAQTVTIRPGSIPARRSPGETGFKDTVIAYPQTVTRLRMKFGQTGQFVWHCHIVEHEDNEMMRPYRIGPPEQGAPASHM
jgi:spore coat protein A